MNKNKLVLIVGIIALFIVFSWMLKTKTSPKTSNQTTVAKIQPSTEPKPSVNTTVYLGQQTDPNDAKKKLCGWVDESEIIVQLKFAEGVVKDTSYEAGFAFSSINRIARLARSGCDFRTGFKYSELVKKGVVQVAVWGYNDNRRRRLLNEPINVTFDSEGKPNIGSPIEVTVLD